MKNKAEEDAGVQRDAERFRWIVDNFESIELATGDREPGAFIATQDLRQAIDQALSNLAKARGETR